MKVQQKVVTVMATICFLFIITGSSWAATSFVEANGTVTDTETGLVWLQDADCFGGLNWYQAKSAAKALESGACGLTDGSVAGQWRLPSKEEMERFFQPNKKEMQLFFLTQGKSGKGKLEIFSNIDRFTYRDTYWSGTGSENPSAWAMAISDDSAGESHRSERNFIWPVRSGK